MKTNPDEIRFTGDRTGLIATVKRANDGPDKKVAVSVTIKGEGVNYSKTIALGKGESREAQEVVVLNNAGSYAYTAKANPVGIEDCKPGNNTATAVITVNKRHDVPKGDGKVQVELIH